MRVVILPTGRTEWHGFPAALERLFPGHVFDAVPTPEEILSYPESFPLPGFTSNTLGDRQHQTPPEDLRELLARAAREAIGDRFSEAADLVLVLDDVEVANRGNEEMIIKVVRAAVDRHLEAVSARVRGRSAEVLRQRVSLHLLRPMIEGWFFGDARALERAGAPTPAASFVLPTDPEDFNVADPAYLEAEEGQCPMWVRAERKKKSKPKWVDNPNRNLHPKAYLQWLTREGEARSCTRYRETEHGAAALAGLHWGGVLARPAVQFQYMRALVADVADALGQDPATGPVVGDQASLTSRFVLPKDPVLRNL